MGKGVARQVEARRRARQRHEQRDERARDQEIRREAGNSTSNQLQEAALLGLGSRRRAALTCGWCKGPITPKTRGRIPKWCSASCRQRAWEQARAAASGLAAIEVVERSVAASSTAVADPSQPRPGDWPRLLRELTRQLDKGRLYDRDLPALMGSLTAVLEAVRRRDTRRHS